MKTHFRAAPREANTVRFRKRPHVTAALLLLSVAASSFGLLVAIGCRLLMSGSTIAIGAGMVGMSALAGGTWLYLRLIDAHGALHGVGADLGKQTQIDLLTGLLNRRAFLATMQQAGTSSESYACVLFFDLDRFKDVNDTLGHRAGDQVLVQVAERCRPILGEDLPFARLGGDEFAALLPYDPRRPPEIAGRAIVEALAQPMNIEGRMVTIGASVGIAVGNLQSEGPDELLRRADLAMYEAKGSGRGACRIYDDALSGQQRQKSKIRMELGRSDITSEFTMAYQPLVDARSGTMASVEALLRWRSSALGDVSPATLIAIAEESGDIESITDWTLDQALAAAPRLGGASVAVNISPLIFRQPEFAHRIFDRLLMTGVRPELLTLEITEGILIADVERSQAAIARLQDVGVRVVLDDFGTGFSSLSYLQNFAFDGLKLDKSFLRNVGAKRQANEIIRTMINFGHSLDMKVVVEGVENEWQIRLLQLIGCDLLQGYALGAPMTLDEICDFKPQEMRCGHDFDLELFPEDATRLSSGH